MKHTTSQLRLNIGFLLGQSVGTHREFPFDLPHLELPPEMEVENFKGTARVSRIRQGLLLEGDFSAETVSQCARCLADFMQPIHTIFEELFAFNQEDADDSGLLVPKDGYIDLAPLVREYLLMEYPIIPVCKPDCKGLCLECGENLNLRTCEHVLNQENLSDT